MSEGGAISPLSVISLLQFVSRSATKSGCREIVPMHLRRRW